jgi:hypothetical protein
MLRWVPESRVPVEQLIQHPHLAKLHCPDDEPIRVPLDCSDFEYERRQITSAALHEEIFREALYYYPHLPAAFEQELAENGAYHDMGQYRLLVPGENQLSSDEEGECWCP